MALYQHDESGEKVRATAGGLEDDRLRADGSGWTAVDEGKAEPAKPQPRQSRSTSSSSSSSEEG